MDKIQKTTIRKCRVRLVNDLVIDELLDSVDAHGIFTNIMLEHIKAKESRPEKVRIFLDYLQRRGPEAFEKFLLCLRESGHSDVASYVINEYQNERGLGVARINVEEQGNIQNQPMNTTATTPNIYHTQESPEGHGVQGQMSRSLQETQGHQGPATEMEVDDKTEEHHIASGVQESIHPVSGMEKSNLGLKTNEKNVSSGLSQGYVPSLDGNPSQREIGLSRSVSSASVSLSPGYTGNLSEEYRMETDPRGLLLIINNRDFEGDMGNRDGTDVDCEALRQLFLNLGFGVDVRHNLTAKEMLANLIFLSKLDQLNTVDCLAVAILTHGSEERLYGVDQHCVLTKDLTEPFTSQYCPALHNKPKFFIFNACRGDAEDKGTPSIKTEQADLDDWECISDVSSLQPSSTSSVKIPSYQDFLLAYSTIPGYVSWRHMNDGSWFIQELAKVFGAQASRKHVVDMLVTVNRKVAEIVNSKGVQIPAPSVMLTKNWFLNPL